MARRVRTYLVNLKVIDDEVKLSQMSNHCEPPGTLPNALYTFLYFFIPFWIVRFKYCFNARNLQLTKYHDQLIDKTTLGASFCILRLVARGVVEWGWRGTASSYFFEWNDPLWLFLSMFHVVECLTSPTSSTSFFTTIPVLVAELALFGQQSSLFLPLLSVFLTYQIYFLVQCL